jgi:isoleucyl-tRNA synthetase
MIEDITNWYVKFNRDRLKGKHGEREWIISTSVLYHIIIKYCILIAPFAPFFAQMIYTALSARVNSTDVTPPPTPPHLQLQQQPSQSNQSSQPRHPRQPKLFIHEYRFNTSIEFFELEDDINYIDTFELLKRVAKLIRFARMKTTTHTSSKTPIKYCNICMDNYEAMEKIASCIDLIQTELNIICIEYSKLSDNMKYRIVPNKTLIGKKYRHNASHIYKALEAFSNSNLENHNGKKYENPTIELDIEGVKYILASDEFICEPVFDSTDIYENTVNGTDGNILIKLDFTYNDEIEGLYHLKCLISHIQQTRKHLGLKPWNKINVEIVNDDFNIVTSNLEYITSRLECFVQLSPYSIPQYEYCNVDEDRGDASEDFAPRKSITYTIEIL